MMRKFYFNLLKKWADALCSLQIKDVKRQGIYGGIMCPACSRIHGRCADAVYPLMYMADKTGKKKYLDTAIRLQAWSEHVSNFDGSYSNDPPMSDWKGITVFGSIALAEAIRHHSRILDTKTSKQWLNRLKRAMDFLHNSIELIKNGNINYPISCSLAMLLGAEIFRNREYRKRAKQLAHESLKYFTAKDYLIFGEGHPRDRLSKRGFLPVDLGYNVEESLPSLALYSLLAKDEKILKTVIKSLKAHLEFMLPDGAWDNSWGTRNDKWTYWGSRTSDGCQAAYALLADKDPCFAKAAFMNLELYDECTYNGLLYGGPHYYQHGILPCIHHTFTHAKALATVLDHEIPGNINIKDIELPRERIYGLKYFSDIDVSLISMGDWRATITCYDWQDYSQAQPVGGALSFLYHNKIGPVISSSLTEYKMQEPNNMQSHCNEKFVEILTPGLELESDGKYYRSINDKSVKIDSKQAEDEVVVIVNGKLIDKEEKNPVQGRISFMLEYRFNKKSAKIKCNAKPSFNTNKIQYILPVISLHNENVEFIEKGYVEIKKKNGLLYIRTNASGGFRHPSKHRYFNLVPGFEVLPLHIPLIKNKLEIEITVC